jgi:hypothetical protein
VTSVVLHAPDEGHDIFNVHNVHPSQPMPSELICYQVTVPQLFERRDGGNDSECKGFCGLVILVCECGVLVIAGANKLRDEIALEDEEIFDTAKSESALGIVFGASADRTIPFGNILYSKVVSSGSIGTREK